MEQDYFISIRANLKRAADLKAAERAAEARASRWAKIVLISMLLIVATAVIMFGDNVANWG